MREPSGLLHRYRERSHSLRPFSASEAGFTAQNGGRDPLWLDRVRFHVPTIGIRNTVGNLYTYLQGRKEAQEFQYERTPAGLHKIKFQPNRWLFQAKISFWPVRTGSGITGRRAQAVIHPHRGHADISLNPTRLLAHMAPEVVGSVIPDLASHDLKSWNDQLGILCGQTLDGSDNIIPEDLIRTAIRLDWPRFCQDYASRVVECMSVAVGTPYDASGEWDNSLDRFESLLVLPSPRAWRLQQIEFYHEYMSDNAIEAVRRVEPYALSLSRDVGVRLYERHLRAETVRQDNARSLSMSLGRKSTYLVLYAKALNRLRVEVRFQKKPAEIAQVQLSNYAERQDGMSDLIRDISANAAQRLMLWINEFNESIPRGSPTHKLVKFMSDLSDVCGTGPLLTKILALLLAHGGIIRTGHADIDLLVPQMIKHRLIVRVRANSTRNVVHYRLRRDYAGIVRSIRALEEGRTTSFEGFPP